MIEWWLFTIFTAIIIFITLFSLFKAFAIALQRGEISIKRYILYTFISTGIALAVCFLFSLLPPLLAVTFI